MTAMADNTTGAATRLTSASSKRQALPVCLTNDRNIGFIIAPSARSIEHEAGSRPGRMHFISGDANDRHRVCLDLKGMIENV